MIKAQVALSGASNWLPSEISFTMFVICNAQSILSTETLEISVDVRLDVDKMAFAVSDLDFTLGSLFRRFSRNPGIK
jgi:hypothetical protein